MGNPSQQDISHIAVRFGRRLDRLPAGRHLVVIDKPADPRSDGVEFQVFEAIELAGLVSLSELEPGDYLILYSKGSDAKAGSSMLILDASQAGRVLIRRFREQDVDSR